MGDIHEGLFCLNVFDAMLQEERFRYARMGGMAGKWGEWGGHMGGGATYTLVLLSTLFFSFLVMNLFFFIFDSG